MTTHTGHTGQECAPTCPPASLRVPHVGIVQCDECGQLHPAEYSHEGRWGQGSIYAVVCPEDGLTDYYKLERLFRA